MNIGIQKDTGDFPTKKEGRLNGSFEIKRGSSVCQPPEPSEAARRAQTKCHFVAALTDIANNTIGLIADKGSPENFLSQLWSCWETAEDFRLAHGDYPDTFEIKRQFQGHSKKLADAERAETAALRAAAFSNQKVLRKALTAELRASRQVARKTLADELRASRRKMEELQTKLKELQAEIKAREAVIDFAQPGNSYPDIPVLPRFRPHVEGEGLPNISGVYFLWMGSTVEYVGRSIRLNQRLRLGSHHVLQSGHLISFLPFNPEILNWAESYYIGIVKPPLNFGATKACGAASNLSEGARADP